MFYFRPRRWRRQPHTPPAVAVAARDATQLLVFNLFLYILHWFILDLNGDDGDDTNTSSSSSMVCLYIYILSITLILILVNLPTNDGWDKWGFETTHCVLNPQVCFSLFYIFDYINEHLKDTIPTNGDVRHGREGILRVLYLYRTHPYMDKRRRIFWLVTLKMPVTSVIPLYNLYS